MARITIDNDIARELWARAAVRGERSVRKLIRDMWEVYKQTAEAEAVTA